MAAVYRLHVHLHTDSARVQCKLQREQAGQHVPVRQHARRGKSMVVGAVSWIFSGFYELSVSATKHGTTGFGSNLTTPTGCSSKAEAVSAAKSDRSAFLVGRKNYARKALAAFLESKVNRRRKENPQRSRKERSIAAPDGFRPIIPSVS